MGWRTTGDVAEFLAVAGEYLMRERARNTVILTVSEQLRVNPALYSPLAGAAAAGRLVTQERRLRLYRLGEFAWPDPASGGAPRVASGADAPLRRPGQPHVQFHLPADRLPGG